MSAREILKACARAAATLVMTPAICSFCVRSRLIGGNRALTGSTQALGLIPGLIGQYLRRAFLARALAYCADSAAIEFGTVFSETGAYIGEHVYIGPRCDLGLVHLERDVLLAPAVHIPSGPLTHGVADPSQPIRDQIGRRQTIRIAAGAWIGTAAVVMADVGENTVVGAGAVVTRPLPACVVAGGVPARILRRRDEPASVARPRAVVS